MVVSARTLVEEQSIQIDVVENGPLLGDLVFVVGSDIDSVLGGPFDGFPRGCTTSGPIAATPSREHNNDQ